jgi:DNA-directed RNA polymerase specialized sigma24 family protein
MHDQPVVTTRAEPLPLEDLLRRAREGSPEAAQELFDTWVPCLLRVIRHKLNQTPRLRTIFDSSDFLQEARTVLHKARKEGKVFESVPTFVAFLKAVTLNKVREFQRQYLRTQKSDLNRECSLNTLAVRTQVDLKASGPAVAESPLTDEQFEQLLHGRPHHHQRILNLLRHGWTFRAIATEMHLHERTVRRIVEQVAQESDFFP